MKMNQLKTSLAVCQKLCLAFVGLVYLCNGASKAETWDCPKNTPFSFWLKKHSTTPHYAVQAAFTIIICAEVRGATLLAKFAKEKEE